MAEKTVDLISPVKSVTNKLRMFPSNLKTGLYARYGSLASYISQTKKLKGSDKYYQDEIRYVVNEEMAVHLSDVLLRRTGIAYEYQLDKNHLVPYVAAEMSKILQWTKKEIHNELDMYYDYVSNYLI